MKSILSIPLLLLVISLPLFAQIELSGPLNGVLAGDTTYHVIGNILVEQNDRLTIEPGAEFYFDNGLNFLISGYLCAVGTETDSIIFKPFNIAYWQGIDFVDSASDSSELGYCLIQGSVSSGIDIEHSDPTIRNCSIYGNSLDGSGGGIRLYYSDSPIENCLFEFNTTSGIFTGGGGLYCYNSTSPISNCVFLNNTTSDQGGGMHSYQSSPIITNCLFQNNHANGPGGGLYFSYTDYPNPFYIEDCEFLDNSANSGGGICFWTINPNTVSSVYRLIIVNNTVSQNGGGIYGHHTYLTFEDCLIADNTCSVHGGGLYLDDSNSDFINCTISNNTANFHGGGVYLYGSSNPTFLNSIISGNQSSSGIYFNGGSGAGITYCDIWNNAGSNFLGAVPPELGSLSTINANGDSCDTFYNIYMDPCYQSVTGDSAFRLTENSPCIDAGNPETQYNDPDGSTGDMGAFYFHQEAVFLSGSVAGILPEDLYYVTSTITVETGNSLMINPGAILLFYPSAGFDIYGCLSACGSENDSIKFLASGGGWKGLHFYNESSDSSILDHCHIAGGFSDGIAPNYGGGGILCVSSSPTLQHLSITGNSSWSSGGGVLCYDNSHPLIFDCSFLTNSGINSGGGIACENNSAPQITYCHFSGNNSANGGAVSSLNSSPVLDHCLMTGNSASSGGGIMIDGGIPEIDYCTIYSNNSAAGGIHITASGPVIMNSIISQNSDSAEIVFQNSLNSAISYCNVYNAGANYFSGDFPSQLGIISTINANSDSCDIYYNIFTSSLFLDPGSGNYQLSSMSPCIDAGNPLSLPDPDGTTADIGRFYFNQSGGNQLCGALSGFISPGVYEVIADIYVNQGDSLIIEPGVTMKFSDYSSFAISGYLSAVGTQQDSIKFIAGDQDTCWGAIDFNNSASDSCRLAYCLIKDGYASGNYTYNIGGAIKAVNVNLTINNCTIIDNLADENGGGIYLENSQTIISECNISCNATGYDYGGGGGIYCKNSTLNIDNCIFDSNISDIPPGGQTSYSPSGGAICITYYSVVNIENSVFSHNCADYYGSAVYVNSSPLTLNGCRFEDNGGSDYGGAIVAYNAELEITNCDFLNNHAVYNGGAVYLWDTIISMQDCLIDGNSTSHYTSAVDFNWGSGGSLINCQITNNVTPNGAAITLDDDCSPLFSHCVISNNGTNGFPGGGIRIWGSSPIIEYCIIANNSTSNSGGGIACEGAASPIIDHCTIYGNHANGSGGGIANLGNSPFRLTNSIIAGNTGNTGISSLSSTNFISYNDIYDNEHGNFSGQLSPGLGELTVVNTNGDSCDQYFNIYLDPLLVDPAFSDYNLQSVSPCIDAGNPASTFDPDSTITDLGALYFDQLTSVEPPAIDPIPLTFDFDAPYPNPFNPQTTLKFDIPVSSPVTLKVYDVTGRLAVTIADGYYAPGTFQFSFEGNNFSSGIYFARLTAGKYVKTQKLLLMK